MLIVENQRVSKTKSRKQFQEYNCTIGRKPDIKPSTTRRIALQMYLEGILKLAVLLFFYWVKKWGRNAELPVSSETVEIVELDESHTYISQEIGAKVGIFADYIFVFLPPFFNQTLPL